ncbi:MAG: hypothetical protein H0X33_00770 [Taibaiella sp.]|nr:hypothetical protein [Taibaiella sp.]
MKQAVGFFILSILSFYSFAQTKSEYYNDPTDTIIHSSFLNKNKKITIILPRTFDRNNPEKIPVIIVFDRQNKKIFREVFESINYLVSENDMPESVIIGISTENPDRHLETSFLPSEHNAHGEQMINFVFEELIPWAETNLNVSKNRIFIGHSRYGYFSSYLLQSKLTELTGVISCSPFFTQKNVDLVDSLREKLKTGALNHTVYYRYITGDSVADGKDYLLMKSFLSKEKVSKNFNSKGMEFYEAEHFSTPGLGVLPSLVEIFSFWRYQNIELFKNDSTAIDRAKYNDFVKHMQEKYGDKIAIGIAQFNGLGWFLYNGKKYDAAIQTWKFLLEKYPMYTDAYVSIAKAYLQEKNVNEAKIYLKKAIKEMKKTTFYNALEKQENMTEIQNLLKTPE